RTFAEGRAADGTAIAGRGAGVNPDVACSDLPPCGAIEVRTKYGVRVHRISSSTKKSLANSHCPVSSRYSTVPHTPTTLHLLFPSSRPSRLRGSNPRYVGTGGHPAEEGARPDRRMVRVGGEMPRAAA